MNGESLAVFQPRVICGEEVEPFCMPVTEDTVSCMVAAATNLIWWGMHECLADGRNEEARQLSKMLMDVVVRESEDARQEAERIIDDVFDQYESSDYDSDSD